MKAISCSFFGVVALGAVLLSAQQPGDFLMYAGSYTNTTAKGIYVAEFDSKSSVLGPLRLVAESVSPAQVWVSPNRRFLYAANWQGSTDTAPGDTISAYRIDRRGGDLTFLNKVNGGGNGPNQVVVDPSGKVAVVVNYRSGSVAAFGIEGDGRLTDAFYVDQHAGQPMPPSKQPGPRAHGVVFSRDSRYAYVADIGLDRLYSYRLDADKRKMTPLDPPYIVLKAGSGPRRVQLHPNGKFLYVNGETDSTVNVFRIEDGRLKELQSLTTLPSDFSGNNTTAEILIDSAGRFLYISNRGHGSIAVFAVDGVAGTVTPVEHAPSGGRTPRNFTIDPTGGYLFSSNQDTENIVVHRIDRTTGRLTMTKTTLALPNPGSIAFVRKN